MVALTVHHRTLRWLNTCNATVMPHSPSVSLTPRNITTVQIRKIAPITPAATMYTSFCKNKQKQTLQWFILVSSVISLVDQEPVLGRLGMRRKYTLNGTQSRLRAHSHLALAIHLWEVGGS